MTSQLNVALIRKLRVSLMCLAYYLHIINGNFNNQILVDVQSTGAGIKCLYCICTEAARLPQYRIPIPSQTR